VTSDSDAGSRGFDARRQCLQTRRFAEPSATVISEEVEFGLREIDRSDRHVVGLEYRRASERLPAELLSMLPGPPVGVAG
jgi:hypothetical protein